MKIFKKIKLTNFDEKENIHEIHDTKKNDANLQSKKNLLRCLYVNHLIRKDYTNYDV